MNAWYLSEKRFIKRIVKRWDKSGFKYNAGNINILRYSFRAVLFWSNLNGQKVSKINEIETNPKLF